VHGNRLSWLLKKYFWIIEYIILHFKLLRPSDWIRSSKKHKANPRIHRNFKNGNRQYIWEASDFCVSQNKLKQLKKKPVICGTCEETITERLVGIEICDYLWFAHCKWLVSKLFILQIKVVIYVWSKTRCAFSNCRLFNFCRLSKIVVVYLAIFVM